MTNDQITIDQTKNTIIFTLGYCNLVSCTYYLSSLVIVILLLVIDWSLSSPLHIHQYWLYNYYKFYFLLLLVTALEEISQIGDTAEKRYLIVYKRFFFRYETTDGNNITVSHFYRGA